MTEPQPVGGTVLAETLVLVGAFLRLQRTLLQHLLGGEPRTARTTDQLNRHRVESSSWLSPCQHVVAAAAWYAA